MRRGWTLFMTAGLIGALSGCRTPFGPATVPVANLYPTLNPGSILDRSCPLRLPESELTALLAHLGLLGPLRAHGLGAGQVPLVVRGLERHGYAELDARRSACPVHWVVLRGLTEGRETRLVVEAGMADPPACAAECGIDVANAPASALPRADVYGRRSQVEIWRGASGSSPVEVRRVASPGRPPYWELEYRQVVRSPVP
jgi:hypothetical protein